MGFSIYPRVRPGLCGDDRNVPLDGEPCHARLLCQNVTANLLDDGLGRRIIDELLAVILVVDIVANAYELATIVCAGEKNHCDAKNLGIWDALRVGRVGLEHELVDANRDGPHQKRVQLLVIHIRRRGADISELPFEVLEGPDVRLADEAATQAVEGLRAICDIPFSSCSKHSKVISNSYLSVNLAGLFRTLTPRSDTTDILAIVSELVDCF